jgi:hypothetical protein
MTMITIIGRGHSGTRAISQTLSESGVYMGETLNKSGDLIPPEQMYDACRLMARFIRWNGGLAWDWSALHECEIPGEFVGMIQGYLASVLGSSAEHRGWKIPETTLVFPWIARLFPEIKYIYWIRNPRDSIVGRHKTDDLADFGVPYPATEDLRLRRAISWWYQYALVQATPKPANWITVRFEDFVLRQEETLARLEDYLGMPLARVPVYPESIGRYKTDEGVNYFDFLEPAMIEYGYERPTIDCS